MVVSIADALAEASHLDSESARLDAELLLAKALGKRREYLLSYPERSVSDAALLEFRSLIARRANGEPVAYLLGSKGFWDFDLEVTPAVLIPRPETELIVERVLELYAGCSEHALNAADLGTGSGALAIALARCNPTWQLTAVDTSDAALVVAQENARRLGVATIQFSIGHWCRGLTHGYFELIVANPPYVRSDDPHLFQDGLPFEPRSALVAEDNGLADLSEIIEDAPRCLKSNSWLLLEHGFEQAEDVARMLRQRGYVDIHCHRDYAGQERMTEARWVAPS